METNNTNGKKQFSDYKDAFYDKFGNRINNFIVGKYIKSGEEWKLDHTYTTYYGSDFVVDNKLYFESNNTLIPLNMDFESKDCRACYKIIGEDKEEYLKIVGNEYLCKNNYLNLTLHKQNYSDGTSFYSLEDKRGDFRPEYGSHNLEDLIIPLKKIINLDKKYVSQAPYLKENIKETKKLIHDIEKIITSEKNKALTQQKPELDNLIDSAAVRSSEKISSNVKSKEIETER